MKTFKLNLLGLALIGMILGACSQTGTYETADLMNEQAAEKAGFKLTPFGIGNENMALSDAPCIDSDSGDEFAASASGTASALGTVNISFYNTLTHMVYEFSGADFECVRLGSNNSGTIITAQIIDGKYMVPLTNWKHGDLVTQSFWIGANNCTGGGSGQSTSIATSYNLIGICTDTSLSAGTTEAICEGDPFTLTASVAADGAFTGGTIEILDSESAVVASAAVTADNKTVTYSGPWDEAGSYSFTARYVPSGTNGYKASASSSSTVTVIECGGCLESFSYADNGDDQPYTFFYTPSANMTNVLVEFTFAQGNVVSGLEGFSNNGNGNSSVWSSTMSFEACKLYSFTVDLAADCSGNSPNSNVWTDFKVGGESKSNSATPPITESCSN